jgi:hypothetical protein
VSIACEEVAGRVRANVRSGSERINELDLQLW